MKPEIGAVQNVCEMKCFENVDISIKARRHLDSKLASIQSRNIMNDVALGFCVAFLN